MSFYQVSLSVTVLSQYLYKDRLVITNVNKYDVIWGKACLAKTTSSGGKLPEAVFLVMSDPSMNEL